MDEKICYRNGKKCDKDPEYYDCTECNRKSDRQKKKVIWSDLSSDLKILCRLHEFIYVRKEQVWFTKLVNSFNGELSRTDVSKSHDKMYDLGIIDGEYQKTPDGMFSYCFFIEDEATDFAETIFKHTEEKPVLKHSIEG